LMIELEDADAAKPATRFLLPWEASINGVSSVVKSANDSKSGFDFESDISGLQVAVMKIQ
jgi:hypothetical protein